MNGCIFPFLAKLGHFARMFTVGSRPKKPKPSFPDLTLNNVIAKIVLDDEPVDKRPWYQRFFEDVYAPFINRPVVKFLSILVLIGYLVVSIMGLQHLTVGFNVSLANLFDSVLQLNHAFIICNIYYYLFPFAFSSKTSSYSIRRLEVFWI